jgi:hypothetical protein
MQQRSLLERLVGKPRPWVVWAYAGLAVIWDLLAIVDPSTLHTFMAIVWTILAGLQIGSAYYVRRQERSHAHNADRGDVAH